jgi:hypothetical protein
MVDVHGGDHRHVGVDDVDRIQAAAQAHFQHRQVQPGVGEQPQRGQRAVLEIGQRVSPRAVDGVETGDQRGIVHILAVDAHALVVAQQVRRGVRADLPAGSTAMASMKATVEPLPLVPPTTIGRRCASGAPGHSHTRQAERDAPRAGLDGQHLRSACTTMGSSR